VVNEQVLANTSNKAFHPSLPGRAGKAAKRFAANVGEGVMRSGHGCNGKGEVLIYCS